MKSKKILCLFLSLILTQNLFLSRFAFANNDLKGLDEFVLNEGVKNPHHVEQKKQHEKDDIAWTSPVKKWGTLSKEEKLMITNVAGVAFIAVIGLASWDYGSTPFHFKNEGWFGENTKFGGADKVGHAWSTYVFADALNALYIDWGYNKKQASTYSSLSSWVVMGLMEVGDGFSVSNGFSYEDFTMNTVGALTSFFLRRYPSIDDKIDFRVEYTLNETPQDLLTDYENLKYIAAIKLSGFKGIKNKFLKYLEIHGGYYTRGYDFSAKKADKSRNLYIGLSVNFSRFFAKKGYKKTATTLEYLQIPYTSATLLKSDINK